MNLQNPDDFLVKIADLIQDCLWSPSVAVSQTAMVIETDCDSVPC